MWLSLLTNKYLIMGVILAVLVGGGGIYIKILKGNLATCEAEKRTLETELQVSQASVKTLQGAIEEQNAAVQKLKTDADEREAKHAEEIAKAKAATIVSTKKATTIIARPKPPNKTACEAANDLFNEEIRNAK